MNAQRRVLVRASIAAALVAVLLMALVHQRDQTRAARADADPNRWACIQVVRGRAFVSTNAEYEPIIETAASLATDYEVATAIRSYGDVPVGGLPDDAYQRAIEPFQRACGPYLPFD